MYNWQDQELVDFIHLSDHLKPRVHVSRFKIDHKIYAIGGLNQWGDVLCNFTEIDYINRSTSTPVVERGRSHLQPIHSAAIAPVFYANKFG